MKTALAVFLLLCAPGFAKAKPHYEYQDGVLVKFQDIPAGSTCNTSGSINANTKQNGVADTSSSTNCYSKTRRLYTIAIGEHTVVIQPVLNKKQFASVVSTYGLAAFWIKNSVLAGLRAGTHVQVRSVGDDFYVKVGQRESKYRVVEDNGDSPTPPSRTRS